MGILRSEETFAVPPITSTQLKCALLSYYRFRRQYACVDECYSGFREIADVLVDTHKHFYEIEIKVSKSDLMAEKKKQKHQVDENNIKVFEKGKGANYFYLCVPSELIEPAKIWIQEVNPKYGLLEFLSSSYNSNASRWSSPRWQELIHNVKRATILHDSYNKLLKENMADRMSSALVNAYQQEMRLITSNYRERLKKENNENDKNTLSE